LLHQRVDILEEKVSQLTTLLSAALAGRKIEPLLVQGSSPSEVVPDSFHRSLQLPNLGNSTPNQQSQNAAAAHLHQLASRSSTIHQFDFDTEYEITAQDLAPESAHMALPTVDGLYSGSQANMECLGSSEAFRCVTQF
jgi:hypothetical protein